MGAGLKKSSAWLIIQKLRTAKDGFAFVFASGFGSGIFPFAPGTAGSLAALAVIVLLTQLPVVAVIGFWIFVFLGGLWGTAHLDRRFEIRDPGFVVADEWVGMAIASAGIPAERPISLAVAFVMFRLFDIWKPLWIRSLDKLSKNSKTTSYARAFWVIADDLLAGVLALIITQVFTRWTSL